MSVLDDKVIVICADVDTLTSREHEMIEAARAAGHAVSIIPRADPVSGLPTAFAFWEDGRIVRIPETLAPDAAPTL